MPKLEDLELKIKQTGEAKVGDITKLVNALKRLAEYSLRLNYASKALAEFNKEIGRVKSDKAKALESVANGLAKLAKASSDNKDAASNIRLISDALEDMTNRIDVSKLSSISSAMAQIRSATRGFRSIKGQDPSTTASAGDSEATAAQTVGETGDAADTATSKVERFKEALKAIGRGALTALTKTAAALQKIGHAALTAGKHLASMAWERLKSRVQAVTGVVGNLVHSFARIAIYRALRTAIKAITQGFSEGIKHLYEWSRAVDTSFKKSMDSLSTSAHYLRDSLGAMASPLIDVLAPAIEALVDKFVGLMNVVNQFISTLTGKDTWRKAVRVPTEYSTGLEDAAQSAKSATKAQKELNKALQGFDELNLITTSTTKGRTPTASGKEAEDYSTHFEEVPVADWIKDIKDAIDNGDWAGAGTLLAEKLNGMVKEWKAKEFGNKIGEKFQKGLDFYLAFMKKFEWEDLGTKIGQMFNGIFEKMSAEDLGHALVAHIKAGVSLAKGFLKEAKPTFEALGVAVSTAINDFFDPDFAVEFGETIAAGVNDAIAFLKTAIIGTEKILQNYDTGETITVKVGGIDFKQVGESLMTAIFTAIGDINWEALGETVGGIFTGILDAIKAGIEYAAKNIGTIATAIEEFAKGFFKVFWNWMLPSLKEFLFGGEYSAESANDRPNAPVTTGAGASTPEAFESEIDAAVAGFKGSLEWIEEHNPFNVEVTDNGNTIGTQDEKVGGLNDKLDYTDGTFTSTFGTKNLKNTEKKVNPFKETLDKTKGKFDAFFGTKNLDKTKKRVDPYYTTLRGVGKTYTTTFKTENLDSTKKKVEELNKQLAETGKNWKLTITADLRLKPHQGSYYTVEPMAEGGYPSRGSLFVAGEVPGQTEMVGNINGRTGVASGAEITGIADAVYNTGETEAELLRQQNNLLRQILSKGFNVNLAPTAAAGKWVNQATTAYARATG